MKTAFWRFCSVLIVFSLTFSAGCAPQSANAPSSVPTLSVAATLSAFPQVIRRTPLPGERLGVHPTLEIVFDRPMQPDSTAAAWQFFDSQGKPLAGQVEWPDARTFRFRPQAALQAGEAYSGIFSTLARSAEGVTLPEEIHFDYRATDALVVGQVFPADKTEDVDRQTAITVLFNKPVVALTTREAQSAQPAPITIQPPVAGAGTWVSSSVYVFQPENGLDSGISYQVSLRPTLKDTTGLPLAESFSWAFTTTFPRVTDFTLEGIGSNFSESINNVALDQAFTLTFNQPMERESAAQALTFQNVETGAAVPVKLTWNESGTDLTVKPVSRLAIASFYNLTLAQTARAQDGGLLGKTFHAKLATTPRPMIESVVPSGGKQASFSMTASVYFNTQIKAESVQNRVRVSPQPEQPIQLVYRDYNQRLDIIGLEPSTEYVIRVLPGISDIYGNTIASEYSFSFVTAGLSPYAGLVTPSAPLIFRPASEQTIFFEYINLNSATFSLFRLPFDEFTRLSNGSVNRSAYQTDARPLRQWSPTLTAAKDRFARMRMALNEDGALLPGYYYLKLQTDPQKDTGAQEALIIVANDTLTLKTTPTEALAWLLDAEGGQPAPNVSIAFYDYDLNLLGSANTDKNGLAYLPQAANVWYASARSSGASAAGDSQVAMAASDWGAGVSQGQAGIWQEYWTPGRDAFAYVYTERPIYRPNQPVYIKGILRLNDDLHYRLPSQKQVYVTIDNDQGQIFSQSVDISANGTFALQYDLGADAPVGNYYLQVNAAPGSDVSFGATSFRVAEYVKPQFAVTAQTTPEQVLAGEQAAFTLDAAYYSGGALGNATVDWFMEARPYFYTPPADYGRFSFGDFDYYEYYYNGGPGNAPPVTNEGQGQTDENGHFELSQTMSLAKEGVSQTVDFSANVTDVGGNLVGSSASLTVLGSAIHAGIRPENYVGKQGEAQTFHLAALDVDGKPIAGQTLSVAFGEQRWYSIIRKDENGVSHWDSSVKIIPAGSASAVTDENGLATVTFTPPTGGEYKATVTAKDNQGRMAKASSYLWVSSRKYIPWRESNDRSFQLIADKDSYAPGETAKILIAQPFEGQNLALITVERGHIYAKKVVTLENNSSVYKLPITADMAPVMYVSVMVVKAADGITPPDFKMGVVRININLAQQQINVKLNSDKTSARPGDSVTYTVQTSDLNGKPVQADVSLALVDQAVLALAPAVNPSLLEAFYPVRGLSVTTASSIVLNAEDFNANYQESAPDGEKAGSGGGKGEGQTGIVTVRQNFKDTAFWQAQVLTDKNGQAQVTLSLPDNLTTWQMTARAVTDDTRVGETSSELLSTRPLQIQLQTPRFFVVDDVVTLGAVIHNNTATALTVNVTLQAEGLIINTDAQQSVRVPARQQAYVTWETSVQPGAQRVDLTASVRSSSAGTGSYSDSTKPELGILPGQGLPVLAYHVIETVGSAGVLRTADSVTETISLPTGMDFLDAALNLEVSPSLAASMTDGLTYLNDYPYLCMEQTVSRFLPNLISLEALQLAGKPTSDLQKALDAQVVPALQRINNNQNGDGGWGLWPGSDSQPTTSAYVIFGLLEAQKAGYTVSENVLELGLTYLTDNLPHPGQSAPHWQQNRLAFMLYALARAGRPDDNHAQALFTHRDNLDLYGKALLMQAMRLSHPEDDGVAALLSEINSAAAKSAAGAWWGESATDYWNWNTDTRTTAIVLDALIAVDPQNALIADGIRWLMKHRDGPHWYSTQETAWSLMALTHWLALSGEFETNYAYAIGLNGTLLEKHQANADNLRQTTTLRLDAEKLLADTVNTLVITRGDGPGALYYTAFMDYSLPVKDVTALDQGILVSRQYFHPDDLKTPISTAARGELVQVRLTIIAPASLHYVVIDDPLPAGLEAVDASLQTSQQTPQSYQANDYNRYGWGWWYFYYKQIYDDKVIMSADYLPAGTYTITYLARASIAGEFHVLPLTAKEFYFPDVAGRSAGSVFVVK